MKNMIRTTIIGDLSDYWIGLNGMWVFLWIPVLWRLLHSLSLLAHSFQVTAGSVCSGVWFYTSRPFFSGSVARNLMVGGHRENQVGLLPRPLRDMLVLNCYQNQLYWPTVSIHKRNLTPFSHCSMLHGVPIEIEVEIDMQLNTRTTKVNWDR